MNALLKKMFLKQKILLLGILAAILVAIPTVLFLQESDKAIDVARLEARGIEPARKLLRIVQMVQQHRGLSAMQLNGSADTREQLAVTEHDVERAMAAMGQELAALDNHAIDSSWQSISSEWSVLTGKVMQSSAQSRTMLEDHNSLIAHMLKANEMVLDHFTLRLDPEPDSYFLIDAMLVRAPILRETLGQVRGYGAGMLAQGQAGREDRILLAARSARASDYYDNIEDELALAVANNGSLRSSSLLALAQDSRVAGARAIRLAHEELVSADKLRYPARDYFTVVSEAIDTQLRLSDAALDQLRRILAERVDALTLAKHKLIAVILVLSALAVALAHVIVRSVIVPIGLALDSARALSAGAAEKIAVVEAIADGKLDRELVAGEVPVIDLDEVAHDEVGELLRSIARMSELQRALDLAFAKMAVSLRDNRAALQARDWIKTGLNDVGDLMRGEHDTGDMADRVLRYLAQRLDAQAGAFYLYDEAARELVLRATYALNRRKQLGERCALGQGLVGQAAYERKIICLADVPPDYLPISSGLGTAVPANVMAIPLLQADGLVGALEIASFGQFSDLEMEFLERARDSIAVGFHVNEARHRMQALLNLARQAGRRESDPSPQPQTPSWS